MKRKIAAGVQLPAWCAPPRQAWHKADRRRSPRCAYGTWCTPPLRCYRFHGCNGVEDEHPRLNAVGDGCWWHVPSPQLPSSFSFSPTHPSSPAKTRSAQVGQQPDWNTALILHRFQIHFERAFLTFPSHLLGLSIMGFVASLLRNRPFPSHHGRRCWTHRRWARARSTPSLAWLWLDRLFWPWGPLAPLVNGYAHVDGEGHNGIFHNIIFASNGRKYQIGNQIYS